MGMQQEREGEPTESSPDLPRHDQPTTNKRRRVLRREDRNSNLLQAHPNAEEHAGGGKLAPGLGDGHAEGGEEGEDCSDENDAAAA